VRVAPDGVVVLVERAVVVDAERDELAGVERRAAAEGDDEIGAVRLVRREAVDDVLLHGVLVDLVEDGYRETGGLEDFLHLGGEAGFDDPCITDEQGALGIQ